MIRNYLMVAIRNLQKQKIFAFINVFGLSVGIACFSLLLLFTINEFSFDKFHPNADNIYRPYTVWDPSSWGSATDPHPEIDYTDYSSLNKETLAEAMQHRLPDVVNTVRMRLPWGENLVTAGHTTLRAEVGFADPSFFSIFSFPLKYGTTTTALHSWQDIVLTSSRAKQLFGTDDVVGRAIQIQLGTEFHPFTVSAVAQDPPPNSTIRFDILGNFSFISSVSPDKFIIGGNWHPTVDQTYVLLRPGSSLPKDPVRMDRFLRTFTPPAMLKDMGLTNWHKKEMPVSLKLQPLLHLHTDNWFNGWAFTDFAVIDPKTIWILLAIATGVLLIACINFTTLAIGRSAGRSKEIGVRKVIGAERGQIIAQFLTEAMLLSAISTALGLLLANVLLPWFNHMAGRDLHFSLWLYPQMLSLLVGVMLITGLLAGSYPALVLSGFRPVEVLRNKIRIGGTNLFTQSLVTVQFALSIALIIATAIIVQQTRYMIHKDPGFEKANVIAIDVSQLDPAKIFPAFRQEVIRHPEIAGVASAAAGLGAGHDLLGYTDQGLSAAVNIVDPAYIEVLGMKLIAGRNFDPAQADDTIKRVIINETMMRAFGWTASNAVGQNIPHFQGQDAQVIGVVKNFNFRPLGEKIGNQLFETSREKGFIHFYVRIQPGNTRKALSIVQNAWSGIAPGVPLKYAFLDESINHYYDTEQRWSSIVTWAGGISIFLASLGLLGLATLAAVNRTKEIGIRKILGATAANVIVLLSRDFIKLLLLSITIATPLAWFLMNKWLQGYESRITISWWIFLLAGAGAVMIALITISLQSLKTAMMNPVKSLRTE